jgi:bacillithiol biosynthesis deacetylase BshB1
MLAASGASVVLLDLTRGERATRGTRETRRAEAESAAAALGVSGRECLDLPDAGLDSRSQDHLAQVVAALRRHRPRLVLAMHWNDDHPDHMEGGELVRRATYLAGLRNYPEEGGDPFRPARVLYAMGRRPFTPGLVVDVSAHYGAKRAALAAYRTQFTRDDDDALVTPISESGFLEFLEARDRYFGGGIGAEYGEPFFEVGPARARSVTDLIPEDRS